MRQGQVIITGSMLAAAFTASESAHAGSAVAAATFGGAAGVMFGAAVARPLLTAVVVYEPAPINVEAPRRHVCYVGCLWGDRVSVRLACCEGMPLAIPPRCFRVYKMHRSARASRCPAE